MRKDKKHNIILYIVVILVIITLTFSGLFMRDMSRLNDAYEDLNKIEFLSSSTQRLVRLCATGQMDMKSLFFINDTCEATLKIEQKESITVLAVPEISAVVDEVLENWYYLDEQLRSDNADLNVIILSGDGHFKSMTNLTNTIGEYTIELNNNIIEYQAYITLLLFVISMLVLNNLLRTQTELKQSRQLTKIAQIDLATGLYNRSRCQTILQNVDITPEYTKKPVIIMLDLNDLKVTNDTQGHRMGDELISNFALCLKKACNVHLIPPFLGRYGGDEFFAYYDNIDKEEDIITFLEELKYQADKFNETEDRFQVSYAAGYSYLAHYTNSLPTLQELFDDADTAMYKHKIEVKKSRIENLVASVGASVKAKTSVGVTISNKDKEPDAETDIV